MPWIKAGPKKKAKKKELCKHLWEITGDRKPNGELKKKSLGVCVKCSDRRYFINTPVIKRGSRIDI